MKARHILGVIAILLALGLGYSIWSNMGLKNEKLGLIKKNETLATEVSEMEALKADLEVEVDSLQTAYEALSDENLTLASDLKDAKKRINRRDRTIKAVKATNTNNEAELFGLRAEIQSLLGAKSRLETSILSLQAENDSLRTRTGVLEVDLSTARQDNQELASLNRSIQEEVGRLTLANFKASGFKVELQKKRKSKVTAKSRRAKRIDASFDLADVPEEYQGVRNIYLVISDDKGTPIKLDNPINATVKVNGQDTDIIAAEAKEVNIGSSQRISFKHDLTSKLKKGYYRAAVFTDIGLLGASSFRLR